MSLSVYLWGIRLFTLSALLAWIGVVVLLDPEQTGTVGMMIFSVSLFSVCVGVFTLFVTWVYRKGLGDAQTTHHLSGVFRQAILLSFYVCGNIFFQYAGIWTWWVALLFLAVILLIEFSLRRLFNHASE